MSGESGELEQRWTRDEQYQRMRAHLGQAAPDAELPREREVPGGEVVPNEAVDNGSVAADGAGGEEKLSKRELKRLAKGKKKKEPKDPNRWAAAGASKKKAKDHKITTAFLNTTPKGEKKDLSGEMLAAYQPGAVEAAWQDWWEAAGYYSWDPAHVPEGTPEREKFIMVIPPPNVTGSLHLGHALTGAIQDTLTRWHRMSGHVTLYVPGTDHAGIATQSVVEKKLAKEEGLTRHDLGREAFLERVWQYKEEFGSRITTQLRFLGSSVDWSREAFTMDANLSAAVTEAFVRFHETGILYRGTRLVNWSCALRSAISKIEVETEELTGRSFRAVPHHTARDKYEFGTLTSFAYPVADDAGAATAEEIVVATTRLETMLGDAAVAVHPEDPRYAHLHGRKVRHPFTGQLLPIVLDPVLVDMSFGTGAVKITPAHDANDYECGKRHDLPFTVVLDLDGCMNELCGEFAGLRRYDARIAVEDRLKELRLYRDKVPNPMALSICSRSGDVIEPMLTPQWYVNCDAMAERAKAAVTDGELHILPAFHEATWFQWLNNIEDWCVSRQLWWGHRIPAYFATAKGEQGVEAMDDAFNSRWIVARTEDEARAKAAAQLQVDAAEVELQQDPDVLDTWFSSGLFPFSVFGWPRETADLGAFYPTSLLETGLDILFFWVARMVMMGLQLTDRLPFRTVYLHAMVRDKYGRKMSKSLGNVIDPLEVIQGCDLEVLQKKLETGNLPAKEIKKAQKGQEEEFPHGIPECGTDALRFGLLAYTIQGRNINLDINRLVGYRNFCNKLWNVTRFALTYVSDVTPTLTLQEELAEAVRGQDAALAARDAFILSQLNALAARVHEKLSAYEFGETASAIYSFWLYDLCDFYLEVIKPTMRGEDSPQRQMTAKVLYACLDCALRITHPLMPFVTEELWQRLPGRGTMGAEEKPSIMLAPFPREQPGVTKPELLEATKVAQAIITAGRSMREQYQLGRKEVHMWMLVDPAEPQDLQPHADDIATLCRCARFEIVAPGGDVPERCATRVVTPTVKLLLGLDGHVDPAAELEKLAKELEKLESALAPLEAKLASPEFQEKVDAGVQRTMRGKAEAYQLKRQSIVDAMEDMRKWT